MNHQRRIRLTAKFTAGALAALCTFGALAQQTSTAVLYTYQGQALTNYSSTSKWGGTVTGKTYLPGVAFSFYLEKPLQAGESISFEYYANTFSGVMGDNGAFETWMYTGWLGDSDIRETSNFSKGMGHDSIEAVLRNYNSWVDHKPGLWTSTNVTGLPSGMPYQFTQIVPWVNPVPEADASVMAVLGLAAVGVLARRKAKAQAEALTTA